MRNTIIEEQKRELANVLAEAIVSALCSTIKEKSYPEFPPGNVPISVAATVYGKDAEWIRAGIVAGWLPIGVAIRAGEPITKIEQMDSKLGRINYQISPKKLYEDSGFIWKGEKTASEVIGRKNKEENHASTFTT